MAARKPNTGAFILSLAVALLAVHLSACQDSGKVGRDDGGKEARPVNDALITTKVKTALFRDPRTSGFRITVNTYRGAVQLSGFIDTLAQKRHAGKLASHVEGVKTIHNDLIVTSGGDFSSSDANTGKQAPAPENFNLTQSNKGGDS